MSDIQEYRKAAYTRAIKRTPGKVLNDGIAYANILIETMIGMCQDGDDIFIYSGQFPDTSYDAALRTSLAKKITVILDDTNCIQWMSSLPCATLSKIKLYKLNHQRPNHFFFTSSGAFRLERNKHDFTAEGDFNNQTVLKELHDAFNVLLKDSSPIPTPQHTVIQNCDDGSIGT